MSNKLLLLFFIPTTLLVVYSYGFLDFNLTLTNHPLFLQIVSSLQYLVYFNRPLSVLVYLVIFFLLFVLYFLLLLIPKWRPQRFPWGIFLLLTFILLLAYPMLSYDIFNYMFHSKILWLYGGNPHTIAPLAYEGDLWLRFMRWVHTPSAYGPVFTLIESPAYLIGLGKFVPVLYLMKATMIAFYIWCIYLVGKISRHTNRPKKDAVFSQLLLAFNPFIWLELMINAHNDAVMIALLLVSLLFSLNSQKIRSLLSLVMSILVKYITVLALPVFLLSHPKTKIILLSLLLLAPVLLVPSRFQPWYLLWALIPATLINTPWARIWIGLTSISGILYYYPYLATGFWDHIEILRLAIIYGPTALTVLYLYSLKKLI